MKDVLGLIPHVFYDLIGRIAPGAVTLFMGVILLTDDGGSRALPLIFGEKPMVSLAAIFFAMLLAAYVLGFVLGAIGALFEDGLNAPKFETIAKAGAAAPRKDIRFADLSYIYDFILLRNPAAGSRLAKLRAEHHMCGALLVGSLSLAAFYVSTVGDARSRRCPGSDITGSHWIRRGDLPSTLDHSCVAAPSQLLAPTPYKMEGLGVHTFGGDWSGIGVTPSFFAAK